MTVTFSNFANSLTTRNEVMNILTLEDRIKVSGMLEQYADIHKKRLSIFGKLYGNKKNQRIESDLYEQHKKINERLQIILSNY